MAYPLTTTDRGTDLSPRMVSSSTIVASPATNAETVVCSITGLDTQLSCAAGVFLSGVASLTVGTSGTAVTVRIRTGVTAGAGTVVASTGAITGGITAAGLISQDLQGFDTASANIALQSSSYCLTVQVTGGAAASTVSATNLFLIII